MSNSTHLLELLQQLFAGVDPSGIVLLPHQKKQLQLIRDFDKEDVRTEK